MRKESLKERANRGTKGGGKKNEEDESEEEQKEREKV